MATSDNETLVDLTTEISETDVSCASPSHRLDLGSVVLGHRIGENKAEELARQVRTDLKIHNKLSTTAFAYLLFSDPLLRWSSISMGAYVGTFLRIGLTYLKIWYVIIQSMQKERKLKSFSLAGNQNRTLQVFLPRY